MNLIGLEWLWCPFVYNNVTIHMTLHITSHIIVLFIYLICTILIIFSNMAISDAPIQPSPSPFPFELDQSSHNHNHHHSHIHHDHSNSHNHIHHHHRNHQKLVVDRIKGPWNPEEDEALHR